MRISAKVDYALRACTELAVSGDGPTKGERVAGAQAIPLKFNPPLDAPRSAGR